MQFGNVKNIQKNIIIKIVKMNDELTCQNNKLHVL